MVSPTVAAQLRAMLQVTVEDGTGKKARSTAITVAGKTGTAQKVNEKSAATPTRSSPRSSGMVPADQPRLVILVMVDEPQTERLGAKVAAPAFAQIADFALKRLGIPPSAESETGESAVERRLEPPTRRSRNDRTRAGRQAFGRGSRRW